VTPSYQTMKAMELGNKVRAARHKLKHEIVAYDPVQSRALVADAIETDQWFLRSMPVWDLLQWPNNFPARGKSIATRAEEWLYAARVGQAVLVGGLTARQRRDLARCLRGETAEVLVEAADREHQEAA
jgi:hypothetical protein